MVCDGGGNDDWVCVLLQNVLCISCLNVSVLVEFGSLHVGD